MPATWEHHALHVARDEPHRAADACAATVLAADRQHGHAEQLGLALLVLRYGRVERTVELEASAQRLGIGRELVDVVLDGILGQFSRRRQRNSLPK
jgi:hypothetical protein